MKSCLLALALMLFSPFLANVALTMDKQESVDMTGARAAHKATRLEDGRVLVSGGCSRAGCEGVLSSTEMFDPSSDAFSSTADMNVPRVSHAAIRLQDGRILIAGGWTGDGSTASAEIFDPATGRFAVAGDMQEPRMSAVAVELSDGRVLIIGGESATGAASRTAETFDPATGRFTGLIPLQVPRNAHTATRLRDGRVLVAGGNRGRGQVLSSAEIIDPASGKSHAMQDMKQSRHKHAAALLKDGRVLIIGGANEKDGDGRLANTEIFDPANGTFSPGPDMQEARYKILDAVVTLPSGAVLVAGGADVAEILDVGTQQFRPLATSPGASHMFASATLLDDGSVLVTGGYDRRIRPVALTRRLRIPE